MIIASLVTVALSLTAPSAAAAQAACSWSGVWLTTVDPNAGELTLPQTGTNVDGSYPEPLGGATISTTATDGDGTANAQG